jgi:hypothetical protein
VEPMGAVEREAPVSLRGTPVYDEQGALVARSIRGAAAVIGCDPMTLRLHMQHWGDGMQLISRPVYAGQMGGARTRKGAA